MNSNNGPVPMNINKKPNKSKKSSPMNSNNGPAPMNINKKPKKSKDNGTHIVYVRAHTRIVKNKTQ